MTATTNTEYRSMEEHVIELVAEMMGVRRTTFDKDSQLMDLGDSLDVIELVMSIEEEFEIEIEDNIAESPTLTVQALIDLVAERTSKKGLIKATKTFIAEPFVYRDAVTARIRYLLSFYGGRDPEVAFSADTMRWRPAKEWLCKKMGKDPSSKGGRKEASRQPLSDITKLNDYELLEFYEHIVRAWTRQM